MNTSIEIDAGRDVVRLTLRGPGTVQDCVDIIRGLAAHPGVKPHFGVLADIRGLEYAATLAESRALADERERAASPVGPLAIVVGDDLHHGTSRQFASLSELRGRRVGVFRDPVEAEVWLGMRPEARAG